MSFKKVMVASDHGGYRLKQDIISFLEKIHIEVTDGGCDDDEDSVDYPIYGEKAARAVVSKKVDGAIIICGTGIGISIAANRVKGARAALCDNAEYAKLTRLHNDCNILALGGRFIDGQTARKIIFAWLNTEYEGGRHEKRIKMLDEIEAV
ncbi:MAG: ribose 5-phosphate isomerase B [Chitinivibrionia bacterium]|nr:ribose 5-phosphate isomerase B [Chitinivibrionia bacterium]